MLHRVSVAFGMLGLSAASPPPVAAFSADSFEARILALHNAERARYGYVPLRWDPSLVPGAAHWAAHMARTGAFDHSPKSHRPGVSENMAMGARGYFDVSRLVGTWLAERAVFVPGIFPRTSRTGNWFHSSHYSQIIWPGTTRIGCALASGRGNDYLVCRYSPKGNQDGKPVGYRIGERG